MVAMQSDSFAAITDFRNFYELSTIYKSEPNVIANNATLNDLIEIEGAHTLHEAYESFDLPVGQSASFLVTLHSPSKGYYIVASSRFTKPVLKATGILHYQGSTAKPSLPFPVTPTYQIHWSMKQARTIRWNLTTNAARPNPQGAYHFGTIPITRTVILANSKAKIGGKLRYAMNKVSHIDPGTPLKVADYLNIPRVFKLDSIKPAPSAGPAVLAPSVMGFALHDFVEIIFQNNENSIQSWHLDGHDFWSVGFGRGQWNSTLRKRFYNLNDATSRCTVQVYLKSWSSILVSLDNKGMWNLRSANWPGQYLGQQLYARVWNDDKSLFTEYDMPANALRCGKFH